MLRFRRLLVLGALGAPFCFPVRAQEKAPVRAVEALRAPQKLPRSAQKRLEALLRAPFLSGGHVGIAVRALGSVENVEQASATPYRDGRAPLLFEVNGERRFLPASNQKLWTAAWVLAQLKPEKTFETRLLLAPATFIEANAWPASLPVPLALTLEGEGDPSLTSDDLGELATQIAARAEFKEKRPVVVRVALSRLGAEENGRRYPDGWTLDDATWYYGAPITGWALNRNQVDVTITGASAPGEAATLKIEPPSPFPIFSSVSTVAAGEPSAAEGLHFDRGDLHTPLGDSLVVQGTLEVGKSDVEGVAVPDPRAWVEAELKNRLRAAGLQVLEPNLGWSAGGGALAATHQSAPLAVLVKRFLKSSDNLYGEMLLRRAAYEVKPGAAPVKPRPQIASSGLAARGHRAMLDWLDANGVDFSASRFSDGSGLSRYNLQTPRAMTDLLALAQETGAASAFYEALPIAGVDGTLKNRMKNSAATGNVRAKTGTFSIANCLSGYVTTRDKQRLAVSILTNFVPDGEAAREWQGQVFAALADARW